jgi:hypothetical protein
MEPKTIYIVQQGEYDDYQVLAAFTDEHEANEACQKLSIITKSPDELTVMKLALDYPMSDIEDGNTFWKVSVKNGEWQAMNETCPTPETFLGTVMKGYGMLLYEVSIIAKAREQALKDGMGRIRQHRALQGETYAEQEESEARALKEREDKEARQRKEAEWREEEDRIMRVLDNQQAYDMRELHARQHKLQIAEEDRLAEEQKKHRQDTLNKLRAEQASRG